MRMRWIVRAALASMLLAGASGLSALAESESCVVDDEVPTCMASPPIDRTAELSDDGVVPAPDQDFAKIEVEAAPVDTPADQLAITTRTIGPPVVVQPFLSNAAPAAQTELVSRRVVPGESQKLPPGPPSRLP